MRKVLLFVLALTVGALAVAQKDTPALPVETSDQGLHASYDQLKWVKLVPEFGARSPEVAIVHVDPQTKATELFIRNPVPIHIPIHWHSANETHTVVRGTMVFEHGGQKHTLGPGGFNYIPKKTHHQAYLRTEGLVFITVDGAWDVNWVNGAPTARDFTPAAIGK
jgi:mannose-6-phosphate isomerase-like protein (cupin superfamily)